MSEYTIKLEGTEQLIANLKAIDANIRTRVAVEAVSAGATQIGNKARDNAPVLTGALRNSAGINPKENDSPIKVITSTENGEAKAEIGFRGLSYARIQEFGGYAGRNGKVRITGKHYLGNAINSTQDLVVKSMSDVVKAYLGEL